MAVLEKLDRFHRGTFFGGILILNRGRDKGIVEIRFRETVSRNSSRGAGLSLSPLTEEGWVHHAPLFSGEGARRLSCET